MGTPLDKESPPCPFANFCWTSEAFHAPPVTPEFLTISVSGVIKGDLWNPFELDPPSGGFVLTQIDGTLWRGNDGIYGATVVMQEGFTEFTVTNFSPLPIFMFHQTADHCVTILSNEQVEPTTNKYILGTMKISGVG